MAVPAWWLATRGLGADQASNPSYQAAYESGSTGVNAPSNYVSGTGPTPATVGAQAAGSSMGPNFGNIKAPKGGWSTNPQQYAQQIQAAFGMSPNALAAFLGLQIPGQGGQKYGAGANVLTTGSDPTQFLGSAATRPGADTAAIFKAFTGQDLGEQELGYQFAGLGQYLNNLNGNPITPYQTNVSMQGLSDDPSLGRLLGQLGTYASQGKTDAYNKILAARRADVPEWAPEIQRYLKEEQGLPYLPVEYLASQGLNTTDKTKPFFGAGESPVSLFPFTGNQAGERANLRAQDYEEFFKSMVPLDWAQSHRPAGSEAPFQAGLTFGSPVLRPGPSGTYTDAVYEKSPVQGWTGTDQYITPEAMRIAGFTPEQLASSTGEARLDMLRSLGGGLYNRYEGFGYPGAGDGSTQPPLPGTMPEPPSMGDAVRQLDEWWFKTYGVKPDQNDARYKSERARVMNEARQLAERFYWWQNPAWGPWGNEIAPEDLQRYEALRGDPIQQY